MADSYIGIDEPSTVDKKADTEQLTVGANTVERERIQLAGAAALEIAAVKNSAPSTEYGVVTRNIPSGTQGVNPTGETAGVGVGAAADAEASGDGSVIGLLKRLRTLFSGGLPAALVGGRLDVNVGNSPSVSVTGSLPTGANNIGDVDIATIAAGDNNIGNVDVVSLPSIPAGSANIGDVDVATLPSIPSGSNNIGKVDARIRNETDTGYIAPTTAANQTTQITSLQLLDDVVHAINDALGKATAIAGQLDDTSTTAATEDNVAPVRITAQRGMHVNLRNVSGTELGTAGAPVRVDPTGSTTQPVSGTVTANLAAGSNNIGDVDVLSLPSIPAGSNNIGDVDVLSIAAGDNNIGNVDVETLPALPAGDNNIGNVDVVTLPAIPAGSNNIGDVDIASIAAGDNNIGNVDIVTMPNVTLAQGTNTNEVVGDVAHSVAAAGNPVLVGAYAEDSGDSAPGNLVDAEADAVRLVADRAGAIYTNPHPPRIWSASNEYTSQQTDASVKGAPGASLSLYITDIYFAANAAVNITLEEGTSTLKWKYYASGQGDGASVSFRVPIKLTANTALTVTTSGAVTCTLVVTGYTAA